MNTVINDYEFNNNNNINSLGREEVGDFVIISNISREIKIIEENNVYLPGTYDVIVSGSSDIDSENITARVVVSQRALTSSDTKYQYQGN